MALEIATTLLSSSNCKIQNRPCKLTSLHPHRLGDGCSLDVLDLSAGIRSNTGSKASKQSRGKQSDWNCLNTLSLNSPSVRRRSSMEAKSWEWETERCISLLQNGGNYCAAVTYTEIGNSMEITWLILTYY